MRSNTIHVPEGCEHAHKAIEQFIKSKLAGSRHWVWMELIRFTKHGLTVTICRRHDERTMTRDFDGDLQDPGFFTKLEDFLCDCAKDEPISPPTG